MCGGLELQKPADSEAASVLCDMKTAHSTKVTYHTAGELLQGGAAALLSVCWLLFQEGEGEVRIGGGEGERFRSGEEGQEGC